MDAEDFLLISVLCGAAILLLNDRRWWVRPWLTKSKGNLSLVNNELNSDPERYKSFLRMDKDTFEDLLTKVAPKIMKQNTYFREAISARDRLIITLRYLATGESMKSLHYSFRVGHSTIAKIIHEVTVQIYNVLKNEFLKVPTTTADWLNISKDFEERWQFPNALGALDGKHIEFQAPKGAKFYNYKGYNSIVLLALVDANYRFLYVDVGTNGRISDGGVFRKSKLYQAMQFNLLNFPERKPLPGCQTPLPFVIVADSAFALSTNIMKPFPFKNISWPRRIYNYRLSRARRVVENAFGLLANRWRILLNTINMSEESVRQITQACVVLHNYLLIKCANTYKGPDEVDRRFEFKYGLSQQSGNRAGSEALQIRDLYMEYFNTVGALPWQDNLA